MQVEPLTWIDDAGWRSSGPSRLADPQLVLYFAARPLLASGQPYQMLRERYPAATLCGCSTGGQIQGDTVQDDGAVAAAIRFERTRIATAASRVADANQSRECGEALAARLAADDLTALFVLSDGLNINGSALIAGITSVVAPSVVVTGGLAGDGADFIETLVGCDEAPVTHTVAMIAFYGRQVHVRHGSVGGWSIFGPRRQITKSQGNVLFELDGQPALDLYKRYLGEEAAMLPSSALLFPLSIWPPDHPDQDVVRTVLMVDEAARSMTFAGDLPQGYVAQLMHGSFDRLVSGAEEAAVQAATEEPGLGILISCIGRKLLLGQQIADEIEAAAASVGPHIERIGFYSYGEISPHARSGICELHNQTMTITTITEGMSAADA